MEKSKSNSDICKRDHTIHASEAFNYHCLSCYYKKVRQIRCDCKFCCTGDLQLLMPKPLFKYKSYPQMNTNNCQWRNYFNIYTNSIQAIL